MEDQDKKKRTMAEAIDRLYGPVSPDQIRRNDTVRQTNARLRIGLRPANSVQARQTRVTY